MVNGENLLEIADLIQKGAKYDVIQDPAVDPFPSQFSDLVVDLLLTSGTLGVLLGDQVRDHKSRQCQRCRPLA
jgi:hypothetical protein